MASACARVRVRVRVYRTTVRWHTHGWPVCWQLPCTTACTHTHTHNTNKVLIDFGLSSNIKNPEDKASSVAPRSGNIALFCLHQQLIEVVLGGFASFYSQLMVV